MYALPGHTKKSGPILFRFPCTGNIEERICTVIGKLEMLIISGESKFDSNEARHT